MRTISAWLLTVILLLAGTAIADERILAYHSDIEIFTDGSMIVTETITVNSEQDRIKRGIYRDFPTRYEDRYGNNYLVDFNFLGAERDDEKESARIENTRNGIRIYLGRSNVTLPPGVHTYRLRYLTRRQLGFFEGRDELYWNVNGNGWAFPADKVSATVRLPDGIDRSALGLAYYTGAYGSVAQNAAADIDVSGKVNFHATHPLAAGEGLTIVVDWPAGVIVRPTAQQKLEWFLRDNTAALIAAAGLLFVLFYYFYAWHRVGRDPEAGVIIPLYEPAESLSPAAMRYIQRMGADNAAFSAAVISMAVKGYLSIRETGGAYVLQRNANASESALSKGERALASKLFHAHRDEIELEKSNHRIVGSARDALKRALKTEYNKVMFRLNRIWLLPGVLVSIATLVVAVMSGGIESAAGLFLIVWLTIWNAAVIFLLKSGHWFMGVVFALFEIPALFMLFETGGLVLPVLAALLVILNVVFFHLIKAPTSLGRRVMDRIEGFKLYLSVAEKDELTGARLGASAPEQTPALYERYLPYALALGVEQAWSEKFAKVLAAASIDGKRYSPGWYSGSSWNAHGISSFGSSLGSSLSSAISSAATAPGSSSGGGGGGGFSGGGGGGGGGGGW